MRRFFSALAVPVLLGTLAAAPALASSTASWAITASPNPSGAVSSNLVALSCQSEDSCIAVGLYYTSGNQVLTLAESWNGSAWTLLSTPNRPLTQTVFAGVSCPAANFCLAVGYSVTGSSVRGLVERWNGRAWKVVPNPMPAHSDWAILQSISCTAANACIAVGGYITRFVDAQEQPLSETWDGTAWQLLPTPNPHAENGSVFTGVACAVAGSCEAIGDFGYGDVDQSVLAYGLNGTAWTHQHVSNPGTPGLNSDNSIACTAPNACESVGTWTEPSQNVRPLAEYWNGATWTRQHTRVPAGAQLTNFYGVSCPATSTCVAVGDSANNFSGSPSTSLAESWNGAQWDIVHTPNPTGAQESSLRAVDCFSPTSCMGVGSSYAAGVTSTLAETYGG